MNVGIIICSRLSSNRLPKKAHLLLENKTVISHLVNNIKDLKIPIVVTVPNEEFDEYKNDNSFPKDSNIFIHCSEFSEDPLARTRQVAKQFSFDVIIRITHDKIFIDTDAILDALKVFYFEKAEYLYPSNLIPGTNFEIISYRCLSEAATKYKNVEHISYAVRMTSKNTINYTKNQLDFGLDGLSLLLDYEDDFKLFQIIYSVLGSDARLKDVIKYMQKNTALININKKPLVTVYTCAYNAKDYIIKCIDSVLEQTILDKCEFILIDDCSNDFTFEIMAKASMMSEKIILHRNQRNIGLSSSCNVALKKAKGKYIIRIDADDYFSSEKAIEEMVSFAEFHKSEALYPDNYFGDFKTIQKGSENHHAGGALFNTSALNFIKFTDGLRGFEGYDLFNRAKDRLKIHYFNKPIFLYHQHDRSLSKSNPKFRDKIKKEIDERLNLK